MKKIITFIKNYQVLVFVGLFAFSLFSFTGVASAVCTQAQITAGDKNCSYSPPPTDITAPPECPPGNPSCNQPINVSSYLQVKYGKLSSLMFQTLQNGLSGFWDSLNDLTYGMIGSNDASKGGFALHIFGGRDGTTGSRKVKVWDDLDAAGTITGDTITANHFTCTGGGSCGITGIIEGGAVNTVKADDNTILVTNENGPVVGLKVNPSVLSGGFWQQNNDTIYPSTNVGKVSIGATGVPESSSAKLYVKGNLLTDYLTFEEVSSGTPPPGALYVTKSGGTAPISAVTASSCQDWFNNYRDNFDINFDDPALCQDYVDNGDITFPRTITSAIPATSGTQTLYFDGKKVSSWDRVGDNIINNNPGKVGIGTNNPKASLQVKGSIYGVNPDANSLLLLGTDVVGGNYGYLGYNKATKNIHIVSGKDANIVLGLDTNGEPTGTGKVGIGTKDPSGTLEVSGAAGLAPSLVLRNSSYHGGDATADTSGAVGLQFAFANHTGPKIEASLNTANTAGLKLYGEYGYNNQQLMATMDPVSNDYNVVQFPSKKIDSFIIGMQGNVDQAYGSPERGVLTVKTAGLDTSNWAASITNANAVGQGLRVYNHGAGQPSNTAFQVDQSAPLNVSPSGYESVLKVNEFGNTKIGHTETSNEILTNNYASLTLTQRGLRDKIANIGLDTGTNYGAFLGARGVSGDPADDGDFYIGNTDGSNNKQNLIITKDGKTIVPYLFPGKIQMQVTPTGFGPLPPTDLSQYGIILYANPQGNISYGMGIEHGGMWFNTHQTYRFYGSGGQFASIDSNGIMTNQFRGNELCNNDGNRCINIDKLFMALNSNPPPISLPSGTLINRTPVDGACGGSNGREFAFYDDVIAGGLCSNGTTGSGLNGVQNPNWAWSCLGLNGGGNVNCAATYSAFHSTFAVSGYGSIRLGTDGTDRRVGTHTIPKDQTYCPGKVCKITALVFDGSNPGATEISGLPAGASCYDDWSNGNPGNAKVCTFAYNPGVNDNINVTFHALAGPPGILTLVANGSGLVRFGEFGDDMNSGGWLPGSFAATMNSANCEGGVCHAYFKPNVGYYMTGSVHNLASAVQQYTDISSNTGTGRKFDINASTDNYVYTATFAPISPVVTIDDYQLRQDLVAGDNHPRPWWKWHVSYPAGVGGSCTSVVSHNPSAGVTTLDTDHPDPYTGAAPVTKSGEGLGGEDRVSHKGDVCPEKRDGFTQACFTRLDITCSLDNGTTHTATSYSENKRY